MKKTAKEVQPRAAVYLTPEHRRRLAKLATFAKVSRSKMIQRWIDSEYQKWKLDASIEKEMNK